jgi:hypothetical protein
LFIEDPTTEKTPTEQPSRAAQPAPLLDRSAIFNSSSSSAEDQGNLLETSKINASTSSISPPPTPDSLFEYATHYRQDSTFSISPPSTPDLSFQHSPNAFRNESTLSTIPWSPSISRSSQSRARTPSPPLPLPTMPRISETGVSSFTSPPGDGTIQRLLLSFENERLSEAFMPMTDFITLRNLRMALAKAISDNRVSELDNEVALFIRSLRCLGVAVCREIIDIGFPGHSYSSSSSDPEVKIEQNRENCHQNPSETNGPPHGQKWC